MTDLERAIERRRTGDFAYVFLSKEGEITGYERGILPLLNILDTGKDMRDFSVADKVVGKAAAMLYAKMKIKCLYAEVMSVPAKEILERYEIPCSYGELTEMIRNRKGDGRCPMEQAVANTDDLDAGIAILRIKSR